MEWVGIAIFAAALAGIIYYLINKKRRVGNGSPGTPGRDDNDGDDTNQNEGL